MYNGNLMSPGRQVIRVLINHFESTYRASREKRKYETDSHSGEFAGSDCNRLSKSNEIVPGLAFIRQQAFALGSEDIEQAES